MNDSYFLGSCQIYSEILSIDEKIVIIPELWKGISWDDELFEKYVKNYARDSFDHSDYASENLQLTSSKFFEAIKGVGYYSIFTALPKQEILKLPYDSYIESSKLYNEILSNLIFVGWYPISYIGSAYMDGYYPCVVVKNEDNLMVKYDHNRYMLNEFLLIKDLLCCDEICKINQETKDNQDYWFSAGIYVDKNTFEKIKSI